MPLQNRVSPEGDVVAVAARGTLFGVRGGCFHRPDKTLLPRHFATNNWICCRLQFKGRRRALMQPGLYTELFFLDEATAWAAGHRPCFECRREDAVRYAMVWNLVQGRAGRARAPEMDARLHSERIDGQGRKVTFRARLGALPDGVMVRWRGAPVLLHRGRLLPWSFEGYGAGIAVDDDADVEVLTPPSTVEIIRAGYGPMRHASADQA